MSRSGELTTLRMSALPHRQAEIIINRLIRYAFIFLAAYFVLFGGTYYYQVFGVRVFHHVFTSILLGAWLIVRLLRRRGLPPTPLNPTLYACVALWFVSAFFSIDQRMALENLWFPLTHLLIFFVMVSLIQSGRETVLTETMLLLAALVVLLASVQLGSWFFGGGFATSSIGWVAVLNPETPFPLVAPRLYVPLGVSTWLAAYTAPLIVFAAAWALSARRQAARVFLGLLAALLLIIMLLSGSRGGWISLGAGGALFAILLVLQDARLRRQVRRFAVPLVVLALVAAVVVGLVFVRISADPGHATGDVLRFDLWRGALDTAFSHPVLGVGPGLFGKAYRLVRDPVYVDDRLGTAHNFYFNTFAETGVLGVLVALALGVLLLRSWWRLYQNAETPARRTHLAGALAALVGLGAHSFFDTFTSTPLVLLALGLTAYCVTAPRTRIDPPLRGSRPAAFASLLLVGVYALGLFRSDQAQSAFNASLSGSLEQAQRAASLDPALNLYQLQVAYLTDADANLEQAVAAYQHALELEPTWDIGWINLAALYLRQNNSTQALDALQRAIDIDHRNSARFLWARTAEQASAASPEAIMEAYALALRFGGLEPLPLSPFWTETDLRRQVLETYLAETSVEVQYRVLRVVDPSRLAALVPASPTTPEAWWVVGEHELTVNNDLDAAYSAFTQALTLDQSRGDYYASRARARFSPTDLNIAELLPTTYYESPNAIRAPSASSPTEQMHLLASAVPPRVIMQNFEGVQFAGRVASFSPLPEMRVPGPGHSVMQPWYDLAEIYLSQQNEDAAINVYRAILDRAPDEAQAREQLAALTEGER